MVDVEEVEYPTYRPRVIVQASNTGKGLFAGEPINAGDIIIEYTGDRIDQEEANKRGGQYLFGVTDDLIIDGTEEYNTARYINHSCEPNAEAEHEVTEDRVYIRALVDIAKGEEITFDYGKEFFNDFIKKAGCKCKACVHID